MNTAISQSLKSPMGHEMGVVSLLISPATRVSNMHHHESRDGGKREQEMAEIIQKLIEALSTVQFQLPRTANRLPRSSTDETGYPPCKQQIPKPSPQHCSQASIIGGSNFHSMPVVRRDTTETFVPKISASSHRCLLSTKLRRSVLRAWSSSKLKENLLQNIHTLDPPLPAALWHLRK